MQEGGPLAASTAAPKRGSVSPTGVTASFVRWLIEQARAPLPDSLAHECRRTLLNVLGVAVGAARHPGIGALVRAAERLEGLGTVPLPGRNEHLGPGWTAQVVGTAAHLEDFDDTHLATVIHPGAVTLAVLWCLAGEHTGRLADGRATDAQAAASGRRQLAAAVCGIEAQLRVGMAMTPQHYDAGWHITGTCGVIGAAVTAGLLLDLDESELASAIGAAASMTLGQREGFGTMVKPFHAGKAAANGVLAARLAAGGFTASQRVLEAPRGYFGVLAGGAWDESWFGDDVAGPTWLLRENTYKPFPCGIVGHPAIEAALGLREDIADVEDVESVDVICNPLVPELMGKLDPRTGLEAKFSTAHLVAAALVDGRLGVEQVSDDRAVAADVVDVRRRVRLVPDAEVGREGATVVVTLTDRSTRSSTVALATGSVARPLDDTDLEEKFQALSEPIIGTERTVRAIDAVWGLGLTTDMHAVVAACAATQFRDPVMASRRS